MTFLTAVPLQIPGVLKDISSAANSTDNFFHMLLGSGDLHMFTFSGTSFAGFYQELFKIFLLCKCFGFWFWFFFFLCHSISITAFRER